MLTKIYQFYNYFAVILKKVGKILNGELSKNLEWNPTSDGRWPGERSENLHENNQKFFSYVCNKIYSIFYESQPDYWNTSLNFQRIKPFHTDQYDPMNRGWIHMDKVCHFGGIIYLNKNPEPDTGTSMYRMKDGYCGASEPRKEGQAVGF